MAGVANTSRVPLPMVFAEFASVTTISSFHFYSDCQHNPALHRWYFQMQQDSNIFLPAGSGQEASGVCFSDYKIPPGIARRAEVMVQ